MQQTKYTRFLILSLLMIFLLTACSIGSIKNITGSGVMAEETREVSGISSVKLSTLGHLIITVGDTESLTIEGEDNMFAYLLTEVDGGKLTIQTRPNLDIDPTKSLNFFLTVKTLERIELSSSGDVEISELETDTLEVKITSSGNLDIAGGKVKSQTVEITSSGNYNAEDLESDEADVKLTSSGSATIWVNNTLTADLNSSGNLKYRGSPSVDSDSSSSGEVTQIGN